MKPQATTKRAAATRAANRAGAPTPAEITTAPRSPAAAVPRGRAVLPDGKRPHDAVTFADLIQLGVIAELAQMGGESEGA